MKRRLGLGMTLLVLGACGSSAKKTGATAHAALAATETVPAGSDCAAGGVRITSGVDSNDNGVLDAAEIKSTQLVCSGTGNSGTNGASGAGGTNSLVMTSAVAAGDSHCPAGGTRIDLGLDNGTGGGVTGNGVLESGEITKTSYACSGFGSLQVQPIAAPAGPVGAFVIDTHGGSADRLSQDGAAGGKVSVQMSHGSLGGHVKVFSTGVADASFTIPVVVGDFGPTATTLDVTSNLSLAVATGTGKGFHLNAADNNIYADDDVTIVSGVHIESGKTLTLSKTNATIDLAQDFKIEAGGALVIRDTSGAVASTLTLTCQTFITATGASVNAAAQATDTQGGSFFVNASGIYNQGSIDVSGVDAASASAGGTTQLLAKYRLANSGAIHAQGGHSTDANKGGKGGAVELAITNFGPLDNSGAIDVFGGTSGPTGAVAGGDGGAIDLFAFFLTGGFGDIRNSGKLRAFGGSADATSVDTGSGGGAGGSVVIYADGGSITNAADIDVHGGAALSGASVGVGTGGSAGSMTFVAETLAYGPSVANLAPGNIVVSGNLIASGGSGAAASPPNLVKARVGFFLDPSNAPENQEVILLGYTSIDTHGGAGKGRGGSGGAISLQQMAPAVIDANWNPGWQNGNVIGPSGGVINQANIITDGGQGASDVGGDAGAVTLSTDFTQEYATTGELVVSQGNISANGGASDVEVGGAGGTIHLTGGNAVSSHGTISANGGHSNFAQGGVAAGGSNIEIVSDAGAVLCDANITARGGSTQSGIQGGGSVNVEIVGASATSSAHIDVRGGNADPTTGTGGNAGTVLITGIYSTTTNTATAHGDIQVNGGTGFKAGVHGEVEIAGQNLTGTYYP